MYRWIENVIDKEYEIEKMIKRKEDYTIMLMRNRANDKNVIVRKYIGDCMAYKALTKIKHSNLPIVYEAISNGEKSIVIEEYIEGITVGEVLQTGRYTEEGVERVISQLVDVLDVLHRNNIVHRDVKPENIMVNNKGLVKLIDFNISRICNSTNEKDTRILGTNGFAAPEQYGIAESDPRTDIYALGILINIMLTGEHPAKKMCDGKWKSIVNKCTRINPDERFQSVKNILK